MNKQIQNANTALEVLEIVKETDLDLPKVIAEEAQTKALAILGGAPVEVEVMVFARDGSMLARTAWR